MTWVPFEHEDWVDADLARSDALAELPHAATCPCDECHERNLLRAGQPRIEDDDYRIGGASWDSHWFGLERFERASEAS